VHHSRGQQRGLQRGHTTAIVPSTVEQSLILAFDTRFCSVPPRFFGAFSRCVFNRFLQREKWMDTHKCLRYNSRRKQCAIINASESNAVDELNCRSVLSRQASLGKRRPSLTCSFAYSYVCRADWRNEERWKKEGAGIEFLWLAGQSRESIRVALQRVYSLARQRRRFFVNVSSYQFFPL